MPLALNPLILRRLATFCAVALLTLGSTAGQSSYEGKESRAKEMRQMWQNVARRRPRRPAKLALPATSSQKPGVAARDRKPDARKSEPPSSNAAPQPQYHMASPTIPAQGQDLGITVWRLRPSQAADAEEVKQQVQAKRLRHKSNHTPDHTIFLTAERVSAAAPLREGDLIQLSVESPQEGFLYVIDRERFADRTHVTYGAPYLIFPTARTNKGDNRLGPGILINIPAMTDEPFYFELNRNSDQHTGEELTFIISPAPITWRGDEEKDTKQIKLDEKQFEELAKQMKAETGRINLAGGVGQAQTPEEAEAAKASANDGTKRLKHDSPLPQTIFRVARKPGEPFVITLLLRIAP
jgi:hypothetical protein